jgi:geranylgeranyl diphosphate synthase, type I
MSPLDSSHDHVVLLDAHGRPKGTAVKREIHGPDTPLHLAFSCHVVDATGRVLMTHRSANKITWPSTWTNACCGHPRPGESVRDAVVRHLRDEIGLHPLRLAVALPDFVYRAEMSSGMIEHELCPVFVAQVDGEPTLSPLEADAAAWIAWPDLVDRARMHADTLSPWSVEQVSRLAALAPDPLQWLLNEVRHSPTIRSANPGARGEFDPFSIIGTRVDAFIDDFITERRRLIEAMDPLAGEVVAPLARLVAAGGKRLRPCFVSWGHAAAVARRQRSFDHHDSPCADVDRLSAAVEMLHTFALVHDDVMDRSDRRRGAATAHRGFALLCASRLPATEVAERAADRFGTSAAIVAGDLAFVWADELIDAMHADAPTMRRVRQVFSLLRTEVIVGQYLDLRLAGADPSAEQAITMALLKSGRYSVTRPLELGAVLGSADDETIDRLRRFGDAAGIAFQLRDDVLGVFGDPSSTGKGVTDDLRDGKATLLSIRARQLATSTDRRMLDRCLGDPELDDECAHACRDIIERSGALASVEALIAAKISDAEAALDCIESPAADALVALAHLLAVRSA